MEKRYNWLAIVCGVILVVAFAAVFIWNTLVAPAQPSAQPAEESRAHVTIQICK